MSELTVRLNGEEIKGVMGISYLEGVSNLRIVKKIGEEYISEDYKADSIVIDITKKDYRIIVPCVYFMSKGEFIGCVGRYITTEVFDNGIVTIVNDNLEWIKFKIDKADVEKVRDIAIKGKGSLFLAVRKNGLGEIYDRTPEEDSE